MGGHSTGPLIRVAGVPGPELELFGDAWPRQPSPSQLPEARAEVRGPPEGEKAELSVACRSESMPSTRSVAAAREVLDRAESRLAHLDRNDILAEWRARMGRPSVDNPAGRDQRRALLTDPSLRAALLVVQKAHRRGPVARRAELLGRVELDVRIEQAEAIARLRLRLQRAAAEFRPRWRGRRVGREVIWRAMRSSAQRSVRRQAYYAEDPLYRRCQSELKALAALRNERARAAGYRSFADYRLAMDGLTVASLNELFEGALRQAPVEMRRWRRQLERRTGEHGWAPWDVEYAQHLERGLPDASFPGRSMVQAVLAAVRQWGFARSELDFRIDRHDLASGGLCLAPNPPADVRVIVHPSGGFWSYFAMFHETGHAVAARSVRQTTHLLRDPERAPGFAGLLEAEGGFFEQIVWSPAWLETRPGLRPEQIRSAVQGAGRGALLAIANLAVWTQQELTLYLHPDRDPAAEGARTARRIFGYDRYRPRSFADSFAIESPLYGVSYLLAELIRSQITEAALAEVGPSLWPNRKIGPWLVRNLFRDGASFDWRRRVRDITHVPFGAAAFNREMRRAGAEAD